MKPIEAGCLAFYAWKGDSGITVVNRLAPELEPFYRCGNCRQTEFFWKVEVYPEGYMCECVLTRIDGHEETEEIEEVATA